MATIVLFRGRNTSAILADARRLGIAADDDAVVVVCRENDPLAEEGDVTVPPMPKPDDQLVVVANGGTTAQAAPYLFAIGGTTGGVRVIDLQRDGVTVLIERLA
jgi:hypothetical protein